METLHIHEESELQSVAKEVLTLLTKMKREDSASVLALHGDLGAGKTTYMKALARELDVTEEVTSPTFVVMKHYEVGAKKAELFSHLYHLDLYRIEDLSELGPLNFHEILKDPKVLLAIEWAERADALLPAHTVHMHIIHKGSDTERTITLTSL